MLNIDLREKNLIMTYNYQVIALNSQIFLILPQENSEISAPNYENRIQNRTWVINNFNIKFLVRNNSSIIESFEEYIRPDLLEGDNKFDAGDFGKTRINKVGNAFPMVIWSKFHMGQ